MHFFTKVARLINRTDKFKCSSFLYAVYHRLTIFFDRMDEISKLSSDFQFAKSSQHPLLYHQSQLLPWSGNHLVHAFYFPFYDLFFHNLDRTFFTMDFDDADNPGRTALLLTRSPPTPPFKFEYCVGYVIYFNIRMQGCHIITSQVSTSPTK